MRGAVIATLIAAVTLPGVAAAAPYCLALQGLPEQCLYADGRACQQRAIQLGGVCRANPGEIATQPGPGRFCLSIGGAATACLYPDRVSCQADAVRHQAVCIEASPPLPPPPPGAVDPFAIRRPY